MAHELVEKVVTTDSRRRTVVATILNAEPRECPYAEHPRPRYRPNHLRLSYLRKFGRPWKLVELTLSGQVLDAHGDPTRTVEHEHLHAFHHHDNMPAWLDEIVQAHLPKES